MMNDTASPDPDVDHFVASLASVTYPLTPAQAAPFAALLAGLETGSPDAATMWASLRAARDLAAAGPAPEPTADATCGWSVVLQPLPGLGASLGVRRDADSTELRFRLDTSGTPRGAITIEGTDDIGVLEIKECPGGFQLQGFAGDRELSVALGEAPEGCWTSKPVLGRLGGEALLALGGGPLAGLFTKRVDEPAGPVREPRTAAMPAAPEPTPPEPEVRTFTPFILTHLSGPSPFDEVEVTRRVVIGRDADCDLPLDDPGVSRHHAAVEPTAEGARLTDLGSSNGTYLNGRRLGAPAELAEGDEIAMGHTHIRLGRTPQEAPAPTPTALRVPQDEPSAARIEPPQAPAVVAAPPRPADAAARQCQRCGSAEPDAAIRFCRGCGQALGESPAAPAPSACTSCGRELHPGERFCPSCGQRVG